MMPMLRYVAPICLFILLNSAPAQAVDHGTHPEPGTPVSVDDPQTPPGDQPASLSRVAWVRNTPNPFNPRTVIGFELQGDAPVEVAVRIYDLRGALVRTLLRETLTPTTWSVPWDGKDDAGVKASSGVYLAVVDAASRRLSAKMALVR